MSGGSFNEHVPNEAWNAAVAEGRAASAGGGQAQKLARALRGWNPDPREPEQALTQRLSDVGLRVDPTRLEAQQEIKKFLVDQAVRLIVEQPTRGHYYTLENVHEVLGVSQSQVFRWLLHRPVKEALEAQGENSAYAKLLKPLIDAWEPPDEEPVEGETLVDHLFDLGFPIHLGRGYRLDAMKLIAARVVELADRPPDGMSFTRLTATAVTGLGRSTLTPHLPRVFGKKAGEPLGLWDLSRQRQPEFDREPHRTPSASRWTVDVQARSLRRPGEDPGPGLGLEFVKGEGEGFQRAVLRAVKDHPDRGRHEGLKWLAGLTGPRELRDALADQALTILRSAPDLADLRELLQSEGLDLAAVVDQLRRSGDFWSLAADLAPRVLAEAFELRIVLVDLHGGEEKYTPPQPSGPADTLPELVVVRDRTRGTDHYWSALRRDDQAMDVDRPETATADPEAEEFAQDLAAAGRLGSGTPEQLVRFGKLWRLYLGPHTERDAHHEARWNSLYFAINDALHGSGAARKLHVGAEFDHSSPAVRRGWEFSRFASVVDRISSSATGRPKQTAKDLLSWLDHLIPLGKLSTAAQEFAVLVHLTAVTGGERRVLVGLHDALRDIVEADEAQAPRLWRGIRDTWSAAVDRTAKVKLSLDPPNMTWRRRAMEDGGEVIAREQFLSSTTDAIPVEDGENRRHIVPSHQFREVHNSWLKAHYPPSHLQRSQAAELVRGWQVALDNHLANLWVGDEEANVIAGRLARRLPGAVAWIRSEGRYGAQAVHAVRKKVGVRETELLAALDATWEAIAETDNAETAARLVEDIWFSVDFDWPGGSKEQFVKWTDAYIELRRIARDPLAYPPARLQEKLDAFHKMLPPTPRDRPARRRTAPTAPTAPVAPTAPTAQPDRPTLIPAATGLATPDITRVIDPTAFRTTIELPDPDFGDTDWPPGTTNGILSGDDLTDIDGMDTSSDEDDSDEDGEDL